MERLVLLTTRTADWCAQLLQTAAALSSMLTWRIRPHYCCHMLPQIMNRPNA